MAPLPLRTLLVTLVRHGESQDNQKSVWAGFKDSPLTATGVSQARSLGYALAHVPLAAIYSSDLKRAAATANEILNANVSVPVPLLVQSQSLREQNFGQTEGKSWREGEAQMTALNNQAESRALRFPDGESLDEVNARVATAVRRFVLPRLEALRNAPASSSEGIDSASRPHICIVAHGIAIAELLRVFMSLHEGQYVTRTTPPIPWPWPHPRSSYKRVRLDNTGWTRLELAVPAAPIDQTVAELVVSQPDSDTPPTEDSGDLTGETTGAHSPPGKVIFVRIATQNNVEHLRNLGAFAAPTPAAQMMGGGGGMAASQSADGAGAAGPMTPGRSTVGLAAASGVSPSNAAALARSLGTYDMKVMAREMDRAGNTSVLSGDTMGLGIGLGLLPSGGAPPGATSSGTAAFGSSASTSGASSLAANGSSISDVWHSVCVRVLPLFNGEGLRCPIEDINDSVSLHVKQTLDRGPARALDALSSDLTQLVTTGMYTLTSKLASVDAPTGSHVGGHSSSSAQLSKYADERLLHRLVELWTMFWESVLPYIEGGFLPMQTDPVLVSLTSGTGSGPAPASTSASASASMPSGLGLRTERIDTRNVALAAFRDCMVLPQLQRLSYLFSNVSLSDSGADDTGRAGLAGLAADEEGGLQLYPRLLQMTSVLASVLSGDAAQSGMKQLLRALRIGRAAAVGHDAGAGWSASGLASSTARPNAARSARRPSASAGAGTNPLRKTRNKRPSWLPREAATYGQPSKHSTAHAAPSERRLSGLILSMSPSASHAFDDDARSRSSSVSGQEDEHPSPPHGSALFAPHLRRTTPSHGMDDDAFGSQLRALRARQLSANDAQPHAARAESHPPRRTSDLPHPPPPTQPFQFPSPRAHARRPSGTSASGPPIVPHRRDSLPQTAGGES